MSEELQPSAAADFVLPTRVIELPEPGPNGPLRVRIRYIAPAELFTILGVLPGFSGQSDAPASGAATLKLLTDGDEAARKVAERSVVEPAFTFGTEPEDGKAWWGALTFPNRTAVLSAAMAFAGLAAEVKKADAAQEATAATVGTFPHVGEEGSA
jgi:hypothetical protein